MRRSVTMISVIVLVLTTTGTTATAQAARADISGSQQVIDLDDSQARTWVAGPMEHTRGLLVTAVQWDDTNGTSTVTAVANSVVDGRTGSGRGWGTFRSDFGGSGFEGTYRGTIHVEPGVGPVATWHVVGRGWGEFAGEQVRATLVEDLSTGAATYTGSHLVPGGR